MKTLIISIISGLLYLNPAFAQTQDTERMPSQPQQDTDIQSERTGPADPDNGIWTPGGQREVDRNRSTPELGRGAEDPTSPAPGEGMGQDQQFQPRGAHEQQESSRDAARPHQITEVEPQEGYERVTPDKIDQDNLRNAVVYDDNHESVGHVDQVLVTPEGEVERLVVDVGGFLGIDAHSVAFDIVDVDIHKDEDKDELRVYIPMIEELRTQQQVRDN
ncbi:PRC-barrel domain-containing protein [Desulfonatronum thiosulfatophilum]|uniref:PRC-barrel domain-containing protein n=1 Tax=Desulfonatronum thiosulfatophilum TaxID=617002 RepID=A0A1G6BB43_9BACT|nr:PRC-barrel domain-containing protein [Desulfonatronum thiosulfatophilum]SDB17882.1 PRC-barrel domain-containing protein [Desulfonatronum thiosulfatophilum]